MQLVGVPRANGLVIAPKVPGQSCEETVELAFKEDELLLRRPADAVDFVNGIGRLVIPKDEHRTWVNVVLKSGMVTEHRLIRQVVRIVICVDQQSPSAR